MSFIPSGSSSHGGDDRRYGRYHEPRGVRGLLGTYFAPMAQAVKEHGIRGSLAIVVAAAIAFLPAGLLVWFNHLRFAPVISLQPGQTVVVKPERHERQQRDDQVGGTSLLSIVCEVPTREYPVPLLADDDPARPTGFMEGSRYVRNEQVYLRPAGDLPQPFGLLGRPPLSAWLPPGTYEVLVVYESPRGPPDSGKGVVGFPLVTASVTCTTENRQRTDCRILLPHYHHSFARRLATSGADGRPVDESLSEADLRELLDGIERTLAVPTPAGYVLDIPEPAVRHDDEHRDCSYSYATRGGRLREWTLDQLTTLLDWLPTGEFAQPARARLEKLIDALRWRDYFRGWYLYAAAGVAGLIFTRWGAIAFIHPGRRAQTFSESLKTMFVIFLYSALAWLLWAIFTDGGGCHGPVRFRIR